MLIYVSPRGDKKKREKRGRGERGGLEIRGLFRNDTAVASRRISPETTRTMRSEDDNGGAFLLRAVVTMYLAKAKSFRHRRRYCSKSRKLRERPVPFFLFQTNATSSQRDVCNAKYSFERSNGSFSLRLAVFLAFGSQPFYRGDEKGHDNPDGIPSACANHFPRRYRVENLPCDEIRNFKG